MLEKLKLKMPEGPHAFVAARPIAEHLRGLGCSVEKVGTHLLLPVRLAGLGRWLSAPAARLAGLRHLGVIQLIVARNRAECAPRYPDLRRE